MRILALLSLLWCLCIFGCVSSSSVHPILLEEDLSHDVGFNGTWQQIDVKEGQHQLPEFTCEGWDENARYDLVLKMPGPDNAQKGQKVIPAEYDVAVGKLAGERFLQARRSESITGGPSFFEGVVTYTFAKFNITDDVLLLYPINDQALETLLPKATMVHFTHKPSDWARNIVITESTPRLQQFLIQHHESLFYSTPLKFRRIPTKSDEHTHAPELPVRSEQDG